MQRFTVNNELELELSDSFEQMSDAQLLRMFKNTANKKGFYSAQEHIAVAVCWTKPSLISAIADAGGVASGAEASFRERLRDYEPGEETKCRLCGKKAFRKAYSYTADAEDVRQTGELTVIKHKKRFYAVYVVSRAEDAGKNDSLIADIYEKMTLV